ncbi:MAG: TIGR04086 family membrane protein [Clostridiales bacterium]|nr:TIGR04086 family membrane protein [Clostridiales bacterium]
MNKILKENNNILKGITKGYVSSIIISLISIFIYSYILVNTNVQESTIKIVIIVISAISVLIGSSISSLGIKKNGIINGILVGAFYFVSLYILSSIAITGFGFSINSLIMVISGLILGAIGGVIGVNIRR